MTAPSETAVLESQLHLLVPATTSNKYLCQLLVSAAALNYPVPTLINWGAPENENPFIQHLAKVSKLYKYLKTFPAGKDNDLVLIVDGYDVWFQLRADVLIRRYFAIKKAADHRIALDLGPSMAHNNDVRNTVIFGPDKACWPSGQGRRPACWAVPQSPLPANSFGPFDDRDAAQANKNSWQARPRWLNSGTVIGTVADVRTIFEATLASIHANHTNDSDQFYIANLFGDQEYSRRLLKQEPDLPPAGTVDLPNIEPGKKTELHIGIDYLSSLFVTAGFYKNHLSWLWFDAPKGAGQQLEGRIPNNPHGFELPDDIAASPHPFSAEKKAYWVDGNKNSDDGVKNASSLLPLDTTWRDIPLATNVVTKQIFVVIHFTFEKKLRDQWWDKMWFHPYSRSLLQAARKAPRTPVLDEPVDGRIWWNAERSHLADPEQVRKSEKGQFGGAWSDKGLWLPWNGLCHPFEKGILSKEPK